METEITYLDIFNHVPPSCCFKYADHVVFKPVKVEKYTFLNLQIKYPRQDDSPKHSIHIDVQTSHTTFLLLTTN